MRFMGAGSYTRRDMIFGRTLFLCERCSRKAETFAVDLSDTVNELARKHLNKPTKPRGPGLFADGVGARVMVQ
jgi:hypothetical protein